MKQRNGIGFEKIFTIILITSSLVGCSAMCLHQNNQAVQAQGEASESNIPVIVCQSEDCMRFETSEFDGQGNTIAKHWRECSTKRAGECTVYSGGTDTIYENKGSKETFAECASIDSTGKCTSYRYGVEYVFDSNKNILSYRYCGKFDVTGKCTAYHSGTDRTYDSHGNLTAQYNCCIDKKGQCSSYAEQAVFAYDAKGNLVTARAYNRVNDKKQCTIYKNEDPNYGKEIGASNLACPLNREKFDDYSRCHIIGNYDVVYDKKGAHVKMCDKVDNAGKCTSYSAQE